MASQPPRLKPQTVTGRPPKRSASRRAITSTPSMGPSPPAAPPSISEPPSSDSSGTISRQSRRSRRITGPHAAATDPSPCSSNHGSPSAGPTS